MRATGWWFTDSWVSGEVGESDDPEIDGVSLRCRNKAKDQKSIAKGRERIKPPGVLNDSRVIREPGVLRCAS